MTRDLVLCVNRPLIVGQPRCESANIVHRTRAAMKRLADEPEDETGIVVEQERIGILNGARKVVSRDNRLDPL